jgi:hypothetical protein
MPKNLIPQYKPIRFRVFQHEEITALRDELATERGNDNLSLPDTVLEAVKFYKDNRKNPYLSRSAK